jgi:hypothetical protein
MTCHATGDLDRARQILDAEDDVPFSGDGDRVDVDARLCHHQR